MIAITLEYQLHESVMNEVGKTIGYAKDDIQDALGKGKPNRQFAWLVGGCII